VVQSTLYRRCTVVSLTSKHDEPDAENVARGRYRSAREISHRRSPTRSAFDIDECHVTAFRPISEAARSWSDDNTKYCSTHIFINEHNKTRMRVIAASARAAGTCQGRFLALPVNGAACRWHGIRYECVSLLGIPLIPAVSRCGW